MKAVKMKACEIVLHLCVKETVEGSSRGLGREEEALLDGRKHPL